MSALQACFDIDAIDAEGCTPGVFDATWRAEASLRPCNVGEVGSFLAAHYLRKRPAIVLLCLAMFHRDRPVGCIVFSAPPMQAEKRYGGKVWELSRLYLLDAMPRNSESWLIGKAIKYIKRNFREVTHLLSYADPSAGHRGTIYAASNWRLDGMTDDERKTPRCDYFAASTGQKYGRRGNVSIGIEVQRLPRASKFRFVFQLRNA